MGYANIYNLYKNQDVLLFRECFCMEKIHGTSANISWDGKNVSFHSGGDKHQAFVSLFDKDYLENKFSNSVGDQKTIVYGEAYGGKLLGMSKTYGDKLRFIGFDVNINECWLSVPQANDFCKTLGLEFVHFVKIPTEMEFIDRERDADSVQAVRNGMGDGHIKEGVVLRPIIEVTKNNGNRIVAKHKRKEFSETKTERSIDPEKMVVLEEADKIADDWVTWNRMEHVVSRVRGKARALRRPRTLR